MGEGFELTLTALNIAPPIFIFPLELIALFEIEGFLVESSLMALFFRLNGRTISYWEFIGMLVGANFASFFIGSGLILIPAIGFLAVVLIGILIETCVGVFFYKRWQENLDYKRLVAIVAIANGATLVIGLSLAYLFHILS